MSNSMCSRQVMSTPVISMRTNENIGRIMNILSDEEDSHNGFPVVEDFDPDNMEGVSKTQLKSTE